MHQCLGLPLSAELSEFATFAAGISPASARTSTGGYCSSSGLGLDSLRGRTLRVLGNVADVAEEVWGEFGGLEHYVSHLQQASRVRHADAALSGSAGWLRLLDELEAATLLARPSDPAGSDMLDSLSVRLKAVGPLHRRLCYVTARVAWALECQARDALTWMRELAVGPAHNSSDQSGFADFVRVHESLQTCPIIRDLLHAALRDAAARAAAELLSNLKRVLVSASQNAELRLPTVPAGALAESTGQPSCEVDITAAKEHLAAQVLDLSRETLADFRGRWLDGEIEAMGLGKRHRAAVDRRHQALCHAASRSESTLQVLRRVVAELRA